MASANGRGYSCLALLFFFFRASRAACLFSVLKIRGKSESSSSLNFLFCETPFFFFAISLSFLRVMVFISHFFFYNYYYFLFYLSCSLWRIFNFRIVTTFFFCLFSLVDQGSAFLMVKSKERRIIKVCICMYMRALMKYGKQELRHNVCSS